jgi:hypothetical protein
VLILMLAVNSPVISQTPGVDSGLSQQLDNDQTVILTQREGLADTLRYMRSETEFFDADKAEDRLVTREQRERIRSTWVSFLDRLLILDSISQTYEEHDDTSQGPLHKMAFRTAYAAFLARYRYTLDFLDITERTPLFHTLLNETIPELGLAENTYADLKYHYLHVAIASEFARLALKYRLYGEEPGFKLNRGITDDQDKIWEYAKGKGIVQTIKNGVQIVKDTGFKTLFPIQRGVSEWMGDVKVRRPHQSLISNEQIASLRPRLQPGDLFLERREWYLSNIGLPGFWPHAALYIGTPEQRQDYFQTPDIQAWVREHGISDGDFESLLRQRYPQAYAASLERLEENHLARVIEAVSEGVVFTSLEHSAAADSLAVLRPRLSRLDKAKAILQAFHYSGRPYDFNFDFLTDSQLVCTELVYKAYEATETKAGISFPVERILGRLATPANLIVKQFDQNHGSDKQQFDLVRFLDGQEKSMTALESDLESFRQSWKRPKWHILVQGARQTEPDSQQRLDL